MNKIYITGDTHGDQELMRDIITKSAPNSGDTLIICGDFGFLFWNSPDENDYLDRLERLSITFCFIDGNHENFSAINAYPVEKWNGGKVHRIRRNIFHLMRGQIFNIEGKTFFTFGGAYSIDRWRRDRGYSYWDEELPNNEEYHEASRNLAANGMKVDYIITHTVPTSMIHRMGMIPVAEDMELTGYLEWILHETDFKHWYAGHWHMDKNLTDDFTLLLHELVTPGNCVISSENNGFE